jgi:hypothetical protein
LVNVVAFAGQFAFLRSHLPWPLAGQVAVAAALESVAVFLALHAHVAALANDAALRLRLSSYTFAAAIGVMNYSHYAGPGWRPTFPAIVTGLMSAGSPWLWAVHSRRVSRDALMAAGLVEPHALRLGPTRWAWHPIRSARVMWLATWDGTTSPRVAVTRWQSRARPATPPAAVSAAQAPAITPPQDPPPATGAGSMAGGTATTPSLAADADGMTGDTPARAATCPAPRRTVADIEAQALAVMAGQPDTSGAALARQLGVSERTGQRLLARLSSRADGTAGPGNIAR